MAWYHEIASSLADIVRRRGQDAEMNEEMRFHIEMETRRHMEAGMSESDATRVISSAIAFRSQNDPSYGYCRIYDRPHCTTSAHNGMLNSDP